MKKLTDTSLYLSQTESKALYALMLIIVFLNINTLYDSLLIILLTLPLLALNIGLRILFAKFNVSNVIEPTIIMLSGAVTIAYSVFASNFHYNIFSVSFGAYIVSLIIGAKAELLSDRLSVSIKTVLRIFGAVSASLLIWGLVREFLASGAILSTFVSGGIKVFPKKLGNYVYSSSAFFLIASLLCFVSERFRIKNIKHHITGFTRTVLISAGVAFVISMMMFGIAKLNIPGIASVLPYIMCASLSFLFSKFLSLETSRFITTTSLVFVYIFTNISPSFITTAILSAIILMLTVAIVYVSQIIYTKKGTVSVLLLICSFASYIYEIAAGSII